jgi:von Willebrand factor type D domain
VPENAKPFFDKLSSYVSNKLNGVEVNDVEVLREIYTLLTEALTALRKEYFDTDSFGGAYSPYNLEALKRLPPFITNIRFSFLNQLANDPLISLKDVLYLYRPYAFDPAELLPPFTMHGEIADGKHYFTFDGRHFTFPGSCSYILARDFAEGNFSVVANMKDGHLQSVSVTDKSGFIEVNSDGLVKYRDRDSDFPIHEKTLHAWRTYFTFNILTTYGASIECAADLSVCHVEVSGYYAGRVRGLLGNGNGEPFDDFALPDGKNTEDVAQFGNSYKTQKQCGAASVPAPDTSRSQSNEFCAQYFGRDSSLRIGFVFVNPTSYREACEAATSGAANAQQEACKIAAIYVSRLRQEFIPLSLPKACTHCTVGTQKVDVGDLVSVKVPQKEADIVVVFDTALGKELSLVTELVNEIRKELKPHGISDVHIVAIGYNSNDRYVSHYTTKGKFDYRGRFEAAKTSGVPEDDTIKTGNRELDDAVHEIEKSAKQTRSDLSRSPDARAFQRAIAYPFRATATKTIIAVRSDGIPYSLNPVSGLWNFFYVNFAKKIQFSDKIDSWKDQQGVHQQSRYWRARNHARQHPGAN